jgi:signal transduction histidine kinase
MRSNGQLTVEGFRSMAEPAQAIDSGHPHGGRLAAVAMDWAEADPGAIRQARGRRVARDLVELSRLQSGAERLELTELDLAALLGSVCADYQGLRLEGPRALRMCTDSRRLARVLFTLLDNAYLHGAPPVTVSFDAGGISVEDSGSGFSPRVLARATQPFVTGERSRGRGVGLGIAIAARQVTLLGGELELTNSPCGGAIARVSLPAAVAALAGL